jgi:hypothetical protein
LWEETYYNDWEENPREGQDLLETLTGEQFWLMEKMSHLDKVSLLDNAGFLHYAPSGCKIPQLFVNGRYEQSWTY